MVGHLLELCSSHIMINQQHSSHDTKHLVQKINLKEKIIFEELRGFENDSIFFGRFEILKV